MFSRSRRGFSSASRDSYVTPLNGMDDVIVRSSAPSAVPFSRAPASQEGGGNLKPAQGRIPRLDLDPSSEADGAKSSIFHFNENKFILRSVEANGSSPQEKIIIDVLRRRQEARVVDLPYLAAANRRRAFVLNNMGGSKTELLPRPQTPFADLEFRKRRTDILGFAPNDLAPNNTPTYAPDRLSSVTGAVLDTTGHSQEGAMRRARTDPRFDAHVTTYARDQLTNVAGAAVGRDGISQDGAPRRAGTDPWLDGHVAMLNRRRNSEGVQRVISRGEAAGSSALARAASARSQERPPSRSHDALSGGSEPEPQPARKSPAPNSSSSQLEIPDITVSAGEPSALDHAAGGSQMGVNHNEASGSGTQGGENQWRMKDEPEYIESFQLFNGQNSRRPVSGSVRDLKRRSEESKRSTAVEVKERLLRPPVRFSAWDSAHGGQLDQDTDRCPNCHEKLIRVPSRYIAVRQDERNFFSWIFSKWKNVSKCF